MDGVTPAMFEHVTLVDRTGLGDCEIIYDGLRIVFKPGETRKIVPSLLADFLYQTGQQKVWTTEGQYVHRFALADAPDDLIARTGPEAMDDSLITIDTTRAEGWDTTERDRLGLNFRLVKVDRSPSDYANVSTGPSQFSGRER